MDNIKRFARSSGIFFIGNILSKITIFLLLPLCTRTLEPDEYGYYDLSITYVTIITYCLYFEIWTAVLRFMYDKDDERHRRETIYSGMVIFLCSTLAFVIIGITAGVITDYDAIPFIFLYGLAHNIQQLYSYILRGYKRNILFAASGVINALAVVLLSMILILRCGMGYKALYIAYAAGNLAQAAIIEVKLRILPNLGKTSFNRALTKAIFIYSLPLAVNSVAYWLLTSYNRTVISRILTLEENGYFAVGSKFGSMISLVTTCFTFAWQEFSFSRAPDDESNGRFFSAASEKYMEFLFAGVALLLPCCRVAFSFYIGSSYHAAMDVLPLFIITAAVSAYSTFTGNIFFAIKDTKSVFISTIAACVCNLLLGSRLVELLGINGANISMLVSFVLNILIRHIILKKRIGFSIKYRGSLIFAAVIVFNCFCYTQCGCLVNCLLLAVENALVVWHYKDIILPIVMGKRRQGGAVR